VERLGLLNVDYIKVPSYGYFGKKGLPWEKRDMKGNQCKNLCKYVSALLTSFSNRVTINVQKPYYHMIFA
jgi:hypothetical protein